MIIAPNSALLVVDVQNDFVTGSLAVPGATQALDYINSYIASFDDKECPIIFTKDFHKVDHPSFAQYGGIWPPHCIVNSWGGKHPDELDVDGAYERVTILKGYDKEAYSGFEGTPLHLYLKYHEILNLYICGLATDYCVKATVLDALNKIQGQVFLLTNACAGVDPTTTGQAIAEMRDAGVQLV